MLGRESAHLRACRALTFCVLSAALPSMASATVLVFGDRTAARNQLASDLAGLGETVTSAVNLPADLTSYQVIWHVSAFTALASGEQDRLTAFVSSGRGLHLSGEQICCETMNDSLEAVINALITGGSVQVGSQGNPLGPYTFNTTAIQGVTTAPHVLSTWSATVPGAMAGSIGEDNALAHALNGKVLGAAWDENDMAGGRGRLSILMDVDWFTGSNRLNTVSNLQTFLTIPEPATLVLLGVATLLMPLGGRRR